MTRTWDAHRAVCVVSRLRVVSWSLFSLVIHSCPQVDTGWRLSRGVCCLLGIPCDDDNGFRTRFSRALASAVDPKCLHARTPSRTRRVGRRLTPKPARISMFARLSNTSEYHGCLVGKIMLVSCGASWCSISFQWVAGTTPALMACVSCVSMAAGVGTFLWVPDVWRPSSLFVLAAPSVETRARGSEIVTACCVTTL